MSKRVATDPTITGPARFHEIRYDATRASAGNEDLQLPMVATWNGSPVAFNVSCSRYVASDAMLGDVWTEGRVFVSSDDLTDTARRALNEVAVPLAQEWLASDEYRDSRALAFAYMLKDVIREDARYGAGTHRSSAALAKHHVELNATDDLNLARAISALAEYQSIMEMIPADRTEES